jgi:hypothetical protein
MMMPYSTRCQSFNERRNCGTSGELKGFSRNFESIFEKEGRKWTCTAELRRGFKLPNHLE